MSRFTPAKSRSLIVADPKPCSKSIHQTHQLDWWKGSTSQIHVLPASSRWEAAGRVAHGCKRVAVETRRLLGGLVHFSSYWVSCCGSLLPTMVTALKNTFAAMPARPGLECSQYLSTVEK